MDGLFERFHIPFVSGLFRSEGGEEEQEEPEQQEDDPVGDDDIADNDDDDDIIWEEYSRPCYRIMLEEEFDKAKLERSRKIMQRIADQIATHMPETADSSDVLNITLNWMVQHLKPVIGGSDIDALRFVHTMMLGMFFGSKSNFNLSY